MLPDPTDVPTAVLGEVEVETLLCIESDDGRRERLRSVRDPAALARAIKSEVDRSMDADGRRALALGRLAAELSLLVDDPEVRAYTHWTEALGLTAHSEFGAALEAFGRARAAFTALGRPVDAARVATREVQALAMSGDLESALALGHEVRATFQDNDLDLEAAHASINIGAIEVRMGRNDRAAVELRRALEGYRRAGNRKGMAQAHANLGNAAQQQDRYDDAGYHLEAALAIFEELAMPQSAAGVRVVLAQLRQRAGRFASALEHLTRARAAYRDLDLVTDAALVQLEEAGVRVELNMLREAAQLAEEVAEHFSERGMDLERLRALMVLGAVRLREGSHREAEEVLLQAREGWLQLGNHAEAAFADLQVGAVHLDAVQTSAGAFRAELGGALQRAEGAVGRLRDLDAPTHLCFGLGLVADLKDLRDPGGDGGTAEAEEVAELAASLGSPSLRVATLRRQGRRAHGRGDHATAERCYREAIELLEEVRAGLRVDAYKSAYFGSQLAVYLDLVDLLLDRGRPEEAFETAERARSRALLDLVEAGAPHAGDQDPLVQGLRSELDAARQELDLAYLAAEGEKDGTRWARVVRIEERVARLGQEIARLGKADAVGASLVPRLEEIAAVLPEGATLVQYVGTTRGITAFTLDERGIRSFRLGELETVRSHLDRLYFCLQRVSLGGQWNIYSDEALVRMVDEQLAALHRILLAPLELEQDGRELVFTPFGALHGVPFAALHDGTGYLIDRGPVSVAPSASVYALCRRRVRREAGPPTAFGVPVDDIPAVREEIEDFAGRFGESRAFLGDLATLDAFRRVAPNAGLLHVATHGVHRPDNPMFSGLRFADGWLAAADLYALDLRAEIVVLSACESSAATLDPGNEHLGLIRGFMYAGVPSLVGSLWAVKDRHTYELMTALYRRLAAGETLSRALRGAQLELRERHPNPYHWAAFTVTGDGERRLQGL